LAHYPEPVARLIEAFQRLPGIGPKTAQRLTFFLLKRPVAEVRELSESLVAVKERIVYCGTCFNVTDQNPCRLCADPPAMDAWSRRRFQIAPDRRRPGARSRVERIGRVWAQKLGELAARRQPRPPRGGRGDALFAAKLCAAQTSSRIGGARAV